MSLFNEGLWNEGLWNEGGTSTSAVPPPCPALSIKPTRAILITACRQTLLDPNNQWWTDTELNTYIEDWQQVLQDEFELVWGSASIVTASATLTLTQIAADILRLDAVYWNGRGLVGRSKEELDDIQRNWRSATPATPEVVFQNDSRSLSLFPPPLVTGTLVLEYPKSLTLSTNTSTISIPAWARYSAPNYVAFRAFLRAGPNQDINRALKRKAKFALQRNRIRTIKDNFFAERSPHLKPSGVYEGNILRPRAPLVP